ncbi:biotin transporter BioY [Intrasporangium calvum]|uniref:biotin transporter BioY n=1 Tax=Intrasporangium calvum TaxID=53358 RepID=UPI000DF616FD|nr:biotin transporter BioY [Intrasporangium calvum]AXG13032.1 biotin transporter BioY [Intrasporangium calvum]
MSPSPSPTRDLALTATFAGFIAVLGLVPAFSPFGFPVPITVQSLGIMIAGAVLGARRGAAAVLLFLFLVALGLPLLSGGRGGLGVFAGPSVGYLVGFPVAAFVIGALIVRRGAPYHTGHGLVAIVLGGIIVLYAIGVPATAWRAGISLPAAMAASALFLVGDLAKAVLATLVAGAVHRGYPGLLPQRGTVAEHDRHVAFPDEPLTSARASSRTPRASA